MHVCYLSGELADEVGGDVLRVELECAGAYLVPEVLGLVLESAEAAADLCDLEMGVIKMGVQPSSAWPRSPHGTC